MIDPHCLQFARNNYQNPESSESQKLAYCKERMRTKLSQIYDKKVFLFHPGIIQPTSDRNTSIEDIRNFWQEIFKKFDLELVINAESEFEKFTLKKYLF